MTLTIVLTYFVDLSLRGSPTHRYAMSLLGGFITARHTSVRISSPYIPRKIGLVKLNAETSRWFVLLGLTLSPNDVACL